MHVPVRAEACFCRLNTARKAKLVSCQMLHKTGDDQNVPFSMSQHKMSLISNVPDQNVPFTNVPFNVPFFPNWANFAIIGWHSSLVTQLMVHYWREVCNSSLVTRHSSLNFSFSGFFNPFVTRHSSLVTHFFHIFLLFLSFVTHPLSLIIPHFVFFFFVIRHSSLVTQYFHILSLFCSASLVTRHSSLNISTFSLFFGSGHSSLAFFYIFPVFFLLSAVRKK